MFKLAHYRVRRTKEWLIRIKTRRVLIHSRQSGFDKLQVSKIGDFPNLVRASC